MNWPFFGLVCRVTPAWRRRIRRRKAVATTGRSYGGPSEKFVGGLGGGVFRSCPLTSQKLPLCGNHQTERILGQLLRRKRFRTPGTSQKLFQKSALRCIRLPSVLEESKAGGSSLCTESRRRRGGGRMEVHTIVEKRYMYYRYFIALITAKIHVCRKSAISAIRTNNAIASDGDFAPLNHNISLFKNASNIAAISGLRWTFALATAKIA